jgi:hypothetical protein
MQYRGKRSADLRIGTNRQSTANLAESEFGAPGMVSRCARRKWRHSAIHFANENAPFAPVFSPASGARRIGPVIIVNLQK